MNNREWLYSLEPSALAEWFGKEHQAPADYTCGVFSQSSDSDSETGATAAHTASERPQTEYELAIARKLGECMAERDELQAAYDEITGIAADLCRVCGFSMVDVNGEVVK